MRILLLHHGKFMLVKYGLSGDDLDLLRFDPTPQSGKSKGLVLVLDAHTDLVTGSSISNDFEVCYVFTGANP